MICVKAIWAKHAIHKCKSAHSLGKCILYGIVVLSQKLNFLSSFRELLTMWCFT